MLLEIAGGSWVSSIRQTGISLGIMYGRDHKMTFNIAYETNKELNNYMIGVQMWWTISRLVVIKIDANCIAPSAENTFAKIGELTMYTLCLWALTNSLWIELS
jgi:hypothetical protein